MGRNDDGDHPSPGRINLESGGVIIGFIVNVLSNLAQPKINDLIGKYNSRIREKNKRKLQIIKDEVYKATSNEHEELVTYLKLLYKSIILTIYLVVMSIGIILVLSTLVSIQFQISFAVSYIPYLVMIGAGLIIFYLGSILFLINLKEVIILRMICKWLDDQKQISIDKDINRN